MPLWLAFHLTFSSSSNRSWTRPRDLCSPRRGTKPSLRSSTNCTGWEHRSGSSLSLLFLCTRLSVCTGQHRRISPTSWSTRLISGPGDASVPLPHWCWMSVVHGCPPLATGPFLLLLLVLGTVCPNTSHPHRLCLFFGVFWKLFSSGVHSHDIYRNFCSACTVTLSFADTLIVLFYLLTLQQHQGQHSGTNSTRCKYYTCSLNISNMHFDKLLSVHPAIWWTTGRDITSPLPSWRFPDWQGWVRGQHVWDQGHWSLMPRPRLMLMIKHKLQFELKSAYYDQCYNKNILFSVLTINSLTQPPATSLLP